MDDDTLYLKQNVQVEPLFNQWYAYPLLIAPATAAMSVANSHLKIMKSYVMAPEVHASAVKNPAMLGGPFIDYGGKRADEIRALMERTASEQAGLVELAHAIATLNERLAASAKGHSLEPLYAEVPEPLRGYVELVYDLANQPSFRLIEALLYGSPYYDESLQSLTLSLVEGDERPFAFSTPRLESPSRIHLRLPFRSPAIDDLFRMRTEPGSVREIGERLGVTAEQWDLFASLFTDRAPAPPPRFDGEGVRVRYFGHACLLIETKDVSILTDPVVSYTYENQFFRYTYADLPETIDYVVITHSHADHFMFETLLQLRHRIGHVVVPRNGAGALEDPSLKLILKRTGFERVIDVDEMERIELPGGEMVALPFLGEHADLNIRTKAAHMVRLGGHSMLFAADSANLESRLYDHLRREVGDMDALFIGMECDGAPLSWIYGSLLTRPLDRKMDRSRKLSGSDFERAMAIVDRFHCGSVYVYAMGQEPWLCYVTSLVYTDESKQIVESNRLLAACRERGIEAERLYGHKEITF